MGPTFDDWLKAANELAEREESIGATVNKVHVDADKLVSWAARNRLDIIPRIGLHLRLTVTWALCDLVSFSFAIMWDTMQ
jgi:hypothetical protein